MAGLKVISGMKRSGFSETVHVAGILKRAFRNALQKNIMSIKTKIRAVCSIWLLLFILAALYYLFQFVTLNQAGLFSQNKGYCFSRCSGKTFCRRGGVVFV
jgi:hypothetical protein